MYANHFYVLWDGARPVAFIDGMTTDEQDLRDEMYADASYTMRREPWQMIFGLNTLPEYRRRGCAGRLIEALCAAAQEQGGVAWCSPVRKNWCPIMRSSVLRTRGYPSLSTVVTCGTRCAGRSEKTEKRPGSDGPGRTLRCAGCVKRGRMLC